MLAQLSSADRHAQRSFRFRRLQGPYRAVGQALEVIPRTLAQNCGANVIRTLTKLRAKHAEAANCTFGIDGEGLGLPAC